MSFIFKSLLERRGKVGPTTHPESNGSVDENVSSGGPNVIPVKDVYTSTIKNFNNLIKEKSNKRKNEENIVLETPPALKHVESVRVERSLHPSETLPTPRWLLRVSDPLRIKWDLFVMLLASWNAFVNPYLMAFKPALDNETPVFLMNLFVDLAFMVDIVLNFRTTFYNRSTGDEIFDPEVIARRYMMGKLSLDLLSSVPTELVFLWVSDSDIGAVSVFSLLGLLKISRISRLNKIVNSMRTKATVKMGIRILQLIFFLLMYIHLVCCSWWLIVSFDGSWIPPTDFIELSTELYSSDVQYQYWMCFYHSVIMLTSGELGPRNSIQSSFCGCVILIGAIITAVMFGDMVVLMSNLKIKDTKFQEIHTLVNTAMKNMKLPENLQQRVSDYLIYTDASLSYREEFEAFRTHISPSLYEQVLHSLYKVIIADNEIFREYSEISRFIIPKLTPTFTKPDEMIVSQGDYSEDMCVYFIAKGDCEVLVTDETQRTKRAAVLHSGTHFGEIALISGIPRTATVKSLKYCTLAVLHNSHFLSLREAHPHCIKIFKKRMYTYDDKYKKFLIRMIRRIPLFETLLDVTVQELVYSLKKKVVVEGEYIYKPAESTNEIYMVDTGQIEIAVTLNDKQLWDRKTNLYQLTRNDSMNFRFARYSNSKYAIKPYTEIYPLVGESGIEDSIHATEKNLKIKNKIGEGLVKAILHSYNPLAPVSSKKRVLGKYMVELVLGMLETGSVFGHFGALTDHAHTTQSKALTSSTIYSLSLGVLLELRKSCPDLNSVMKQYESLSSNLASYVGDFVFCNDYLDEDPSELSRCHILRVFKESVLRIIKENRDKAVLSTPILQVLMDRVSKQACRKSSSIGKYDLIKQALELSKNNKEKDKFQVEETTKNLTLAISEARNKSVENSHLLDSLSRLLAEHEVQSFTRDHDSQTGALSLLYSSVPYFSVDK